MLGLSTLLIVVTIADGFRVAESAFFVCVEALLNLMVTADLLARIKVQGLAQFFRLDLTKKSWWWNMFDIFVVLSCNSLFLATISVKHGTGWEIDESLEELFLVLWSVW